MAAQVDAVREAVYNSGWDQAQEAEQLQRLRDEIAKMPDAILGVSIAHYKSALYQYRLLMQKHHDWLVKMKDWMEGYERMLLAQEAGIGEEFDMSWVLEIGLGMLWEPLDWAFAARDLFLEGELSALIGLLPIIPASIRHFDAIRHTFPSLLANVTWLRDDYRSWWRAASSKDIGDVRILADEASHVLGRQPGELYDRVTLSWGWADTKSANPRFEFDTPYFTYDSDLGGRIVSLDVVDLAGRSYEEKLLVATHELIHAEDFLNIRNLDGPGEAIKWLKDATVSSYNWDEITTEYRALKSVDEYLGGVSNDTIKESLAYIEDSFYRGIDSSLKPDYQTIIDDLRNMIN